MPEELFTQIAAWEPVEAIALGGSRAGTAYDQKSDYDVYVYVTGPVSEEQRLELLQRHCSRIEVGNHFWEYEDNCILNNGVDIDILYRDLDAFARDVSAVVDDCRPANAYTTCMWHNLEHCKVLYDRDGRFTALQQRFDRPYPEALRSAVLSRQLRLLRHGMPAYEGQLAKATARRDLVSMSHRTSELLASYFDALFAFNRQTHPGEKRLLDLAERDCRLLPENARGHVEGLLEALFSDSDAVPQRAAALIDGLEAMLEAEGLSVAELLARTER